MDTVIYVLGPSKTPNQLMASVLRHEMNIETFHGGENYQYPNLINDKHERYIKIILWDCNGKSKEECLLEFDLKYMPKSAAEIVAYYNVNINSSLEEEAITRGVRGFFYQNDPLETIKRGILVIANGELWISRQIVSKYILQYRPVNQIAPSPYDDSSMLTEREKEIIGLVSIGASNIEVADKLCISPHTVKTHIYNIFKKIGVTNRLQAALWAGKNIK